MEEHLSPSAEDCEDGDFLGDAAIFIQLPDPAPAAQPTYALLTDATTARSSLQYVCLLRSFDVTPLH